MEAHFLPSLLDRLEGGSTGSGSRRSTAVSASDFSRMVERDIARILGQPRFLFDERDLDGARYPLARESVLNYGLQIPCGVTASPEALDRIRAEIKQAIERYEPRAVRVEVSLVQETIDDDENQAGKAADRSKIGRPRFIVKADLVAHPYFETLRLLTELDLVGGGCRTL